MRRENTTAITVVVLLAAITFVVLVAAAIAHAKEPPPAKTCPAGKVLECRAEIVRLQKAVEWQRQRSVVDAWPGDAAAAIVLACHVEHVECGGFLAVAQCESRMNPNAQSGQYKGLFQLSARHRSDPLIERLGWSDPYANALHSVRYVLAHGWGEWQCTPTGGLRW